MCFIWTNLQQRNVAQGRIYCTTMTSMALCASDWPYFVMSVSLLASNRGLTCAQETKEGFVTSGLFNMIHHCCCSLPISFPILLHSARPAQRPQGQFDRQNSQWCQRAGAVCNVSIWKCCPVPQKAVKLPSHAPNHTSYKPVTLAAIKTEGRDFITAIMCHSLCGGVSPYGSEPDECLTGSRVSKQSNKESDTPQSYGGRISAKKKTNKKRLARQTTSKTL